MSNKNICCVCQKQVELENGKISPHSGISPTTGAFTIVCPGSKNPGLYDNDAKKFINWYIVRLEGILSDLSNTNLSCYSKIEQEKNLIREIGNKKQLLNHLK